MLVYSYRNIRSVPFGPTPINQLRKNFPQVLPLASISCTVINICLYKVHQQHPVFVFPCELFLIYSPQIISYIYSISIYYITYKKQINLINNPHRQCEKACLSHGDLLYWTALNYVHLNNINWNLYYRYVYIAELGANKSQLIDLWWPIQGVKRKLKKKLK